MLLLPSGRAQRCELSARAGTSSTSCQLLSLAGAAANQSILEAMESGKIVHVINLGDADATQWLLAARPEEVPLDLHCTAVNEDKDVLTQTAMVLTKEAERFQFMPVVSLLHALPLSLASCLFIFS
jgi:hypothetical protein